MKTGALCLVLGALGAALLACSGGTSAHPPDGGGGSGSGSGSGGGSGGSSSGGVVAACPSSVPASGGACSSRGLSCEYGDDQDLACDAYAVCGAEGQWATTIPASGGQGCPTNAPGSGGCPATYGGVAVGKTCSPNGLECGYSQGRCACTTQQSGPPSVGNPTPVWVCEQPGAGCPEPRPTLGAACTVPSTNCTSDNDCLGAQPGSCQRGQCAASVCDYGSCTLPGGTAVECTNGSWTQALTACAD